MKITTDTLRQAGACVDELELFARLYPDGVELTLAAVDAAAAARLNVAWAVGTIEPVCREYLRLGGDVNARDKDGNTPLHWAVWYGHDNIVELLLAAGADVNARDEDGKTPLHLAAQWGREGCARLLLAAGADVNARDNYGNTPLYYAARWGRADCAQALREAGGVE